MNHRITEIRITRIVTSVISWAVLLGACYYFDFPVIRMIWGMGVLLAIITIATPYFAEVAMDVYELRALCNIRRGRSLEDK